MSTANRLIDPTTRDYVLAKGAPSADDTSASEIVLRLATKLGSVRVPGMEKFGSRLHEVDRDETGSSRRARGFALDALRPMVLRGVLRQLSVEVLTENGLELFVSFVDASGQKRVVPYTYAAA